MSKLTSTKNDMDDNYNKAKAKFDTILIELKEKLNQTIEAKKQDEIIFKAKLGWHYYYHHHLNYSKQ